MSEIDELVGDIAYLGAEVDALTNVIQHLPYDESPGEGFTIHQLLQLIDFAQRTYSIPLSKHAGRKKGNKTTSLRAAHPSVIHETFLDQISESKEPTVISKTLENLAHNRSTLVRTCEAQPHWAWDRPILLTGGQTLSFFELMKEMVRWERSLLKRAGDLIRVHEIEVQGQRELRQRRESRHTGENEPPEKVNNNADARVGGIPPQRGEDDPLESGEAS